MNALLIHNDNLPTLLVEAFESSLKFNIGLSQMMQDGFSFDRVSHEFLERHLTSKQFDAIFIPYTLSNQNYLELSGIRLALHIRLTPEFRHMRVPIIFIGHESKEQIAKLTEFPSFLFTSGIFSIDKFEYESYLKIYDWLKHKWKSDGEMAELSLEDYEGFLNRISIDPPSNYLSHHSVDNELSLLRWSEYLKCDEDIPEVQLNIKTGLFFKYKKAKNPIQSQKTGSLFLIEGKAKVLLIDDEAQKGWEHFYRTLFKTSPSIDVQSLNIDFKLNSKSHIIKEAIKQIETYLPDIILLDLRLCDSDFDNHISVSELTGIKILEKAKEINRGIQVIITTASNKAISFETVFTKGADGFILKDGRENTQQTTTNLLEILKVSIKKALWLKQLSKNFSQIVEKCSSSEIAFKTSLKSNLEISFELLEKSFTKPKYLNYAYLQLFHCIEDFLRLNSIFEFGDKCYVNQNILSHKRLDEKRWKSILRYRKSGDNNPSYFSYGENEVMQSNITTDFKMSCVLVFLFNKQNSNVFNWPKIRDIRNNKAAHSKRGNVNLVEINEIVSFMLKVLNWSNFQKPTKKGLNDEIDQNSLAALINKFQ